jgi:hypothetical protein
LVQIVVLSAEFFSSHFVPGERSLFSGRFPVVYGDFSQAGFE